MWMSSRRRVRTRRWRWPGTGHARRTAGRWPRATTCSMCSMTGRLRPCATGRTGRRSRSRRGWSACPGRPGRGGRGDRVRGEHGEFGASEDGGDGSGAGHELPGAGAWVHGGGLWRVVLSASVDDIGNGVERDRGGAPHGDAGGLPGEPRRVERVHPSGSRSAPTWTLRPTTCATTR